MAVKKGKGKKWYSIVAPNIFKNVELGGAMTSNPENLIGRKIETSLMMLINDYSKYYMKFVFRIKSVQEDKAMTEFDGLECLRDYISRMVLKRIRRVDTVQDLATKDGIKLRVKGLAIIRRKVKSNVTIAVRNKIKDMIKEEVEKSTEDEFIQKIISDGIKNKILKEARKIYPVRSFEIRRVEVAQPTK